jgi:serine/threonine protein kinase/Tfp pilus assembly protein PilF
VVGQTVSHYRILRKLGEGGMGVVYLAQDLKLDRPVALKFLPQRFLSVPEEVARFEQEAKAISALADTHIATIHDIDEAEGERFLVLEYLPGGTLKEKLQMLNASGGELPLADVVRYALQIAEGLGHAHRRHIIHRDVKTDNIMLTEGGSLKITDFGLAKLKGGASLTKVGSTVGTAAYMSPEQFEGRDVDQRSDIFSFGVVLYELLTGRLPFRGEHDAALAYSVVHEEPASPQSIRPSVPPALQAIVVGCLEKDRERRYQSMDDVVAALREINPSEGSRPVAAPTPEPKASPQWWMFAAGGALLVALAAVALWYWKSDRIERRSVAVLPFKNMSEEKDNEYFSDGITEDIIAQLSKIADLRVVSRSSIMRYKNSDKGVQQIARELNVATVLEGSVRRSGSHVRVIAELVDAAGDEHLWAETYDKEMTEIFAIQSAVAHEIASALKARLSPDETRRIDAKPTENVEAYTHYLRGREYYYRYHRSDNDAAIELFKKALNLDPRFALAYAGLGDAYGQRVGKFGYPDHWLDSSIAASQAAISLDPSSGEAYKSLALSYGFKGWLRMSLETLERAHQLNPKYVPAMGNMGFNLAQQGKLDEAIVWMKKSISVDPAMIFQYFGMARVYIPLREYEKGEQWLKKAVELQPDFIYARSEFCELELNRGNYTQADAHADKVLAIDPNDVIGLNYKGEIALFEGKWDRAREYYGQALKFPGRGMEEFAYRRNTTRMGFILKQSGDTEGSRAILDESMKTDQEALARQNEWYAIPYDIACVHAIRGETSEALSWLEKALDAGWTDYVIAQKDPVFQGLTSNPRFKELMSRAAMRVDAMRKRVQELDNAKE